ASFAFSGSSMTMRSAPRPVRVPPIEVAYRLPPRVVTSSSPVSLAQLSREERLIDGITIPPRHRVLSHRSLHYRAWANRNAIELREHKFDPVSEQECLTKCTL